jgi:phosphate transport system substrate-binding protein
VAIALLASGVVVTTMGITSAATGDVAQRPRQLTPGGELHGSGATFPCGYIEQAIEDAENDDLVVTYDCNSSGTGRAEFIEGTVDFAGTDVPLSDAEEAQLAAKGMGYLQFAYVGGGIVIAYNPGSGLPYNLRLSADTIGKIFSGQS